MLTIPGPQVRVNDWLEGWTLDILIGHVGSRGHDNSSVASAWLVATLGNVCEIALSRGGAQ